MKNNYFIDTYYTEKKEFIGSTPDYKIKLSELVLSTLRIVSKFAPKYFVSIPLSYLNTIPKSSEPDFHEEGLIENGSELFAQRICSQLFKIGDNFDFFELYLYNSDLTKDSVLSWSLGDFINLKLDEEEFSELQRQLQKDGLPIDIYYKENTETLDYPKGNSFAHKLRRLLHLKKTFTPKEWKAECSK